MPIVRLPGETSGGVKFPAPFKMGQAEIIKVLEKRREWITAKEVAEILNRSNAEPIRRALKTLCDFKEVLRKWIQSERGFFMYVYKVK